LYHLCMLIFALLVTGANLPAGSADAQTADTTSDVEKLVFEFTAAGENDGHDGDTNEGIVTKLNGEVVDFYGHDGDEAVDENNTSTSSRTFFPMKIANQIAKMKRPVYKVTSLTEGATLKFWDFCWEGQCTLGNQTASLNNSYIKDGEFWGNGKDKPILFGDYKLGETEIGIDLSAEYEDGEAPEAPEWNGGTFLGFGLDFGASATIEIYDAGEDIEASQLPETTASATKAPGYIPDGEKLVFEFTAAGENDGHDGDTNEGIVTKLNGEVVDFYGHDGDEAVDENNTSTSSRTFFPMKIANQIAKMKRPVYKVTSLTDGATLKLWDFCWEGMWTIGDQTGNINNSYIKDGEFLGTQKRNTVVIDYKLGETEIGIDLSAEYEDGEAPEAPEWNGGTFLGFGLDFGASATIEIYDTAEEEIEPSLLPEQSSIPTPPVATPLLKPSFRPAVISTVAPLQTQAPASTVAPLQTQAPASTVAPLQTQVPASTVAPLPEQSNIPAGVPGSNVTPEQSSVPSVSTTPVPNGQEKDTVLPDDEDDEEDEEEEESLNPIKKITAPKQIVLKKGKTKTVTVKLRSKNKSMKTTDDVSVTAVSKKVKVSGRKYNSQRLTFRVKGKKKGNTVIYVIIGEKSRKIKVICL